MQVRIARHVKRKRCGKTHRNAQENAKTRNIAQRRAILHRHATSPFIIPPLTCTQQTWGWLEDCLRNMGPKSLLFRTCIERDFCQNDASDALRQGKPLSAENHRLLHSHWSKPYVRGRHGGVEKRGGGNLTKDTPPQTGFWTPFVWYVFHPPQVSLLTAKFIREGAFSGCFSSPHTFCTLPTSWPNYVPSGLIPSRAPLNQSTNWWMDALRAWKINRLGSKDGCINQLLDC